MKREELKIIIEAMTPDDLEEVAPIEEASYTTPWKRHMFETELKGNPFARLFVARDPVNHTLLGYICFWLVFDELHLMNLSVHPDWRRQGIGEDLARWAMTWGRENGARLAMLEVRASNLAAKRLYEKLGFQVVAARSGYYREPVEDALIMNTSLA